MEGVGVEEVEEGKVLDGGRKVGDEEEVVRRGGGVVWVRGVGDRVGEGEKGGYGLMRDIEWQEWLWGKDMGWGGMEGEEK